MNFNGLSNGIEKKSVPNAHFFQIWERKILFFAVMKTFIQRLSHLNIRQAVKLLGPKGKSLLMKGGMFEIDVESQVMLSSNVLRLTLADAIVSIVDDDRSESKMRIMCSSCNEHCHHMGAALSLVLEDKKALGLAVAPANEISPTDLTEAELVQRELMRRDDRAKTERLTLKSIDASMIWTDYIVTNQESGKSYRVALRGWQRGESFCSCPDFRKNTLGTCKHIIFTIEKARLLFHNWKKTRPFRPNDIAVHLSYGTEIGLHLQVPDHVQLSVKKKLQKFSSAPIKNITAFMSTISTVMANGIEVVMYPDAEQYLSMQLHRHKIAGLAQSIRSSLHHHPLRTGLLKHELLPYQLEGIAFVVETGRAVLADDMGLGKTVQAIGAAELLAQECGISRVLIVCPASVKSQWHMEIGKFCTRKSAIVAGGAADRMKQYRCGSFFTICNYEQVLRDIQGIEQVCWDFIILDEAQRIKNWETKTSRVIKALRSRYALVLSGTPLENRLEELYSVLEFIDDRRLGPDFRFYHSFRVMEPDGRIAGYKNLDHLRALLKPVLLRRTRASVLQQLPSRSTEIIRIAPLDEQLDIHRSNMMIINQIIRKPYLTEMDLLRLRKALLVCRMSADSTMLVNKEKPGYSSKLQRLEELLLQLSDENDRKIVLFSEWTTMLDLIEELILKPNAIGFIRLDGSVPQSKRQVLINQFQNDPGRIVFCMTNAGSTGLNLQAANTVINVDLPWNPAVLEQRIGRVHRMGQKRPVQIYLMVTENTIEERMLERLAVKKDLALAALDFESDVMRIDMRSGIEELKSRLEVLLAEKPAAPIDESEMRRVEAEAVRLSRARSIEAAGGKLMTALFSFMNSIVTTNHEPDPAMVDQFKTALRDSVQEEKDGSVTLKISLPDHSSIDEMAKTMSLLASARR